MSIKGPFSEETIREPMNVRTTSGTNKPILPPEHSFLSQPIDPTQDSTVWRVEEDSSKDKLEVKEPATTSQNIEPKTEETQTASEPMKPIPPLIKKD